MSSPVLSSAARRCRSLPGRKMPTGWPGSTTSRRCSARTSSSILERPAAREQLCCNANSMDDTCRSAEDGDRQRRRAAGALSPASSTPIPGKLGVVEEGALADLLLVDGDPLTTSRWSPIPTGFSHHEGSDDLPEPGQVRRSSAPLSVLASATSGWSFAVMDVLGGLLLIASAVLAIYFSNLPRPSLRIGLDVAFAAFAVWASGFHVNGACALSSW